MKKIGIMYHPMKEAAFSLARELEQLLKARGIAVWLHSAWEEDKASRDLDGTDLILTIGGDGTILRAAKVVLPGGTPITGINLGRLGFMTELSTAEVISKLPEILEGKGWVDERSVLEAELYHPDVAAPVRRFQALNDVVVARGAVARLITVEADIDGNPLTQYKVDGMVVATATGSTAYALAAGGPVLYPQSREILLLPLLPHLCLPYTMVLESSVVVKLRINSVYAATLSVDGHVNVPVPNGASIVVRRGERSVKFLRIHPPRFYATLEDKLKGTQVESNRKSPD